MALRDTFFLFPSQLCSVRCSHPVLTVPCSLQVLLKEIFTSPREPSGSCEEHTFTFWVHISLRILGVFMEVLVRLQKCREVLCWYLGVPVLLKLIKKLC